MLNHVSLSGRLVKDPEIRRTQSGAAVASFCLAVDRDFSNKETGERAADFLECIAWKNTADFVGKYFVKGQQMIVDGRIQTRSYKDKDGNSRKAVEIVVNSAYFCGSKGATGTMQPAGQMSGSVAQAAAQMPAPAASQVPEFVDLPDDGELPF